MSGRSRVAVTLVALGLATVLGACTLPGSGETSGQEAPVTVVVATRGLALNPYSPLQADRQVGRLLFRGLVSVGPDGMPAADLAEAIPTKANGGISADGLTVTYRVRQGLSWHDGRPLTARDVAFTVRLIRDGLVLDDPAEDFRVIRDVEAPDEATVIVRMSRPDSVLAWRLAPYVLPEHLLGKTAAPAEAAFWAAPVGSGPYRFSEVRRDGTVELVRVGEAPAVERLIVRPSGTQADAMRIFNGSDRVVWLDARSEPTGVSESLSTTWGPAWRKLVFDTRPGTPWSDVRVRRAVSMMIAQSAPPEIPASAYPYGYRPAPGIVDTRAASALLDSLGWRMGSEDARWKDGKRLVLFVGVPTLTQMEGSRLETLAITWRFAGVGGGIVGASLPFRPTWPEGGTLVDADRDGYLMVVPAGRPFGWAWPLRGGDEPSWSRPWGLNVSALRDPALDAAYERVRRSPDPETALERSIVAGRIAARDYAELYVEPIQVRVLSKGVRGVRAWPVEEEALAQAVEWVPDGDGSSDVTGTAR